MSVAWLDRLKDLAANREPCVIVTVARVRGSAPREVGARMIVTAADTCGSIGGGQLEFRCIQRAAEMLRDSQGEKLPQLQSFPLGPECGQCCGGVVEVLFDHVGRQPGGWVAQLLHGSMEPASTVLATTLDGEPATTVVSVGVPSGNAALDAAVNELLATCSPAACRKIGADRPVDVLLELLRPMPFDVVLFGAGHVGSALVSVLAGLDCTVYWIDSRAGLLPANLPANVRALPVSDPVPLVRDMPSGASFLVMTHSHPLDLALCEEILARNDFAYCGLIGSRSKRNRFEKRLRAVLGDRFDPERLTCPVGVAGIRGKKPPEIAIAVAAELLCIQSARQQRLAERGRADRELKLVGK